MVSSSTNNLLSMLLLVLSGLYTSRSEALLLLFGGRIVNNRFRRWRPQLRQRSAPTTRTRTNNVQREATTTTNHNHGDDYNNVDCSSSSSCNHQLQRLQRPLFPGPGLVLPTLSSSLSSSSWNNNNKSNNNPQCQQPTTTTIHTIAAPMVACSDYAFRCLCRQYGVDLTFAQMLHAKNLCYDDIFRQNHLDLYECCTSSTSSTSRSTTSTDRVLLLPSQQHLLQDLDLSQYNNNVIPSEWQSYQQGPVMVQLAGNTVSQILDAARIVLNKVSENNNNGNNSDNGNAKPIVVGIDLNCGCPQGIAKKGNYGAFLMESNNGQERIVEILTTLRQELPCHVPISAKIRLPLQQCQLESRIRQLVRTGIDFLTIHGRTMKENKTTVGPVHLHAIQQAVQIAQNERPNFPIVANGGVECLEDVFNIQRQTGAVAVMSSEALLETPHVFLRDNGSNDDDDDGESDGDTNRRGCIHNPRQRLDQQLRITRDYLHWATLYPPLPGVLGHMNGSFNIVRGHLFKFLHPYLQEHTDLRDRLASHDNTHCLVDAYDIVNDLERRYECYRINNNNDDEYDDDDNNKNNMQQLESSRRNSSWYRRHWDAKETQRMKQHNKNLVQQQSLSVSLSVEDQKQRIKDRIVQLRALRETKQQQHKQQQQECG